MRTLMIAAAIAATLTALLLSATPALALNGKSWVANNGSDSNNCATPATACRTFQQAYSQTNGGGEIGVVNAGDYGPLVIGQSISITNDSGGEAGLLYTDGTCHPEGVALLRIQATPGAIVSVRGLVFEGCGSATYGIEFDSGTALHIQNCVFRNFEGGAAQAFFFTPSGSSRLFISDTIFFNNGAGARSGGIVIEPEFGGSADIVMERVQLQDNTVGLLLSTEFIEFQTNSTGIHAVLRDSVASGNAADGIRVFGKAGGPPAVLFVDSSASFGNTGSGIVSEGALATVLVSDSTITRNGTGVSAVNFGRLISYGNNRNNNNVGPEGTATGSLGANF